MQFYPEVAFGLFARFYTWMTANPIWLRNSTRLLADVPQGGVPLRIVDLGAGPGNSAMAMGQERPQALLIAVDISAAMVQLAHRNRTLARWSIQRLAPVQADVFRLPFASASVDAVTAHSFLYLLPNVKAALAEVHRVLKPGGSVAFLEPLAASPQWGWLLRQPSLPFVLSILLWRLYSSLHRRFSQADLADLLWQAGFQQVHTEVTLGNFALFGRGRKPGPP